MLSLGLSKMPIATPRESAALPGGQDVVDEYEAAMRTFPVR